MIYQYFGVFISLIAIILGILRFKENKMTLGMLSFWIFIWIAVILVSIYPNSTNILASMTGIQRGLDLIIILGLFGSYYLIFKIYTMIESMEQEITKLVSEIALLMEEIEEKKDIETKSK
ncbi:MAG: DUF2304 family protein [Methanobacteriaceae archaeon]|nr:DUF2304 family protein [Methanobacteriaceae archaeon]